MRRYSNACRNHEDHRGSRTLRLLREGGEQSWIDLGEFDPLPLHPAVLFLTATILEEARVTGGCKTSLVGFEVNGVVRDELEQIVVGVPHVDAHAQGGSTGVTTHASNGSAEHRRAIEPQ